MTANRFSSWSLTESAPAEFASPDDLEQTNPEWITACVPGTVAQSLQQARQWNMEQTKDFDASDWWYYTHFEISGADLLKPLEIDFKGLATLCEIWLNGLLIHNSANMFLPVRLNITEYIEETNHLYLCFRSLNNSLSSRMPRPAWKTRLVSHQNLRGYRTTLLGKIPGWSPPISPVGPWQPIEFCEQSALQDLTLHSSLQGNHGLLEINFRLNKPSYHKPSVLLHIDKQKIALSCVEDDDTNTLLISGQVIIDKVKPWYPHTHGEPSLYPVEIEIKQQGSWQLHSLPAVGFKSITLDTCNESFLLKVNGQALFCRGACWTINDIVSLNGETARLENTLRLMQQAGANMIRIGGTMVYEQNAFYQHCDKLGILVWQDFMFANMDYPVENEAFKQNVSAEIEYQLNRLSKHPCIAIYCGNSEVEQQATMMGMRPDSVKNPLFYDLIPAACKLHHPGIPYVPSTPYGDPLPFHTDKGLTHYYGIGAYQRPLNEIRQHAVKFTPETLGFANIPITETRNKILQGELPVIHDPRWKRHTPRDRATGWDFEDIRDFYLQQLYDQDPAQLRYTDPERYLRLSEITTGEVMHQVFSEWRSQNSQCAGGLVWFLKDLWNGAGWGIIDSFGNPKACYYFLKRCWQPVQLLITNEQLNGLDIHVINESAASFQGELSIRVLNKGQIVIASHRMEIDIEPHKRSKINADELLEQFYDLSYSYRFGPAKHNVVCVQLLQHQQTISHELFFPANRLPETVEKTAVKANASVLDEHHIEVTVETDKLLYAVNIEAKGHVADDNFFHVIPGITKKIRLKRTEPMQKRFSCYLSALNLGDEIKLNLSK